MTPLLELDLWLEPGLTWDCWEDLNQDGLVDGADLGIFLGKKQADDKLMAGGGGKVQRCRPVAIHSVHIDARRNESCNLFGVTL